MWLWQIYIYIYKDSCHIANYTTSNSYNLCNLTHQIHIRHRYLYRLSNNIMTCGKNFIETTNLLWLSLPVDFTGELNTCEMTPSVYLWIGLGQWKPKKIGLMHWPKWLGVCNFKRIFFSLNLVFALYRSKTFSRPMGWANCSCGWNTDPFFFQPIANTDFCNVTQKMELSPLF